MVDNKDITFFARKDSNRRNGEFFSLRGRVPNGTKDGFEFGRLRQEKGGWNTWADTKEFDLQLRAAMHRAGRHAPLPVVLAALKQAFLDQH